MIKRKIPIFTEVSDEEEEESSDRRGNLRPHKEMRYSDQFDIVIVGEDDHSQTTSEDLLPVVCGSKEGLLDPKKLKNGNACIWCEDKWYTPPEFEDFGGKVSSKKWKASITCNGESIQYMFKKGLLTTVGYKKRQRERTKKKKSSNHYPEESSQVYLLPGEDKENEAENWSPGADDVPDTDVSEENGTFLLPKKVYIPLERLPDKEPSTSSTITEPVAHHLTVSSQRSVESWRVPLSEVSQSEDENEDNTPATAEIPEAASSLKTEPPTIEVIFSEPLRVLEIEQPHEIAEPTAVVSDDHDATQSPHSESEQETRADRTCAHSSNMEGAAESSDVETMDTEQLKRETLELQVKVLRLQEKYYSLKISRYLKMEPLPEQKP